MEEKDWSAFSADIAGRVQGVAFRYHAQLEAEKLGVTGWIRNCDNGHVELWAEGRAESLKLFLQWLSKGPPYSRVEKLESKPETPLHRASSFRIVY